MGRVTVEIKLESLEDVWAVRQGIITSNQARSVVVENALVDTGATMLSLPTSIIQQLGLKQFATKRINSSIGVAETGVFDAVRLTIQDRSCTMDVLEVPDSVPVLIGQLPMESLDFVVDLQNRTLIGNPAHGGEHVYEMYGYEYCE